MNIMSTSIRATGALELGLEAHAEYDELDNGEPLCSLLPYSIRDDLFDH